MKCEECEQRQATLHLGHFINGKKKEVHVCEICAKEKGYLNYPDDGYSLHQLLSGLFNVDAHQLGTAGNSPYQKSQGELTCPHCDLTFTEFKKIGKFGCARCYETFSDKLDSIFRRIHSGNMKHHGKIPKRKGGDLHVKKQLESYRTELKRLIEQEAFEEAAEVRDTIKALEADKEASGNRDDEAGDAE